ncbi:pimeloyl-ACP methyl esterase BioG family protein [Campylobacter jejuni]|uniref:pimeloyl-ACP methyl esterase BioG family protein n=2 Tax=Campylobacter jejuni TaxID=197 RepID=UPI0011A65130|nr:pimeloyl-ACP methyl esterase BioG family protein [Campylobacter jejuni]
MKYEFLCKVPDLKKLIVVFGGFASHPSHFSHLKSDKNVILFYDYENFDLNFDFKAFDELFLIAFSMGVCVANRLLKELNFKQKIAINGTNLGIDKSKGIHPTIFKKTLQNFKLEHFKETLFKERKSLAKDFIFKDEKALKIELEKLFDFALTKQEENLLWDKVYSSKEDEIFPPNALKNSFKNLIFLDEPHFAFFHFKTWDEL